VRGAPRWATTVSILQLLLLLAGCGEPFEPIRENDLGFSIFGVLDASADTQWVRIAPIRNSLLTEPTPPGAVVTLEHTGTGAVTSLMDSIFVYPADFLHPGQATYARNYWTTERIEPGATYRLTASGSSGMTSTVLVPIPEDADTVVIGVPVTGLTGYLRMHGVDHLAMVHVFPGCLGSGFRYQGGGPEVTADTNRVIALSLRLACETGDTIRARGVRIILSGSSWPYDPDWNDVTAYLPEVASNVVNGYGFLGGILTRTIRLDECHIVTSGSSEYCEVVSLAESLDIPVLSPQHPR